MRILMVTAWSYPHVGGLSSHVSSLTATLTRGGHDVDVLSAADLPRLTRYLLGKIRTVLNLGGQGLGNVSWLLGVRLGLAIAIHRRCKAGIELVHCHDVVAYAAARYAERTLGTPVVLTVHGYLTLEMVSEDAVSDRHRSLVLGLEARARDCRSLIAVDTRIRDYLVERIGVDPHDVQVCRNFVDPDELVAGEMDRSVACRTLDLPENRRLILCARRLVPKNGVEFAVRAMADLDDGYLLVVAGGGICETELRDLAARLGADGVRFLGALPPARMRDLYAACDYALVPSSPSEGFEEATSIAAIEAMSAGVPVVASSIGGLTELIRHEETGLLVPPCDPSAIARALLRYERDAELRARIVSAARDEVVSALSADAAATLISGAYRRASGDTIPVARWN